MINWEGQVIMLIKRNDSYMLAAAPSENLPPLEALTAAIGLRLGMTSMNQ